MQASTPQSLNSIGLIPERAYQQIRAFLLEESGIELGSSKHSMVSARIVRRLRHHGLDSFDAYADLLRRPEAEQERRRVIDLLSTHETRFFREPKHYDFLRDVVIPARQPNSQLRVWSAASSSGEEAYSAAMLLADRLGMNGWSVVGSDISEEVVSTARIGHYPFGRTDGIPNDYLKRYCLRGTGRQQGTFLIGRELRQKVSFSVVNLNRTLPDMGQFDVVFLRNVLIYFNLDTKREIIERVTAPLKPGGYFIIGHSDSLGGRIGSLKQLHPSVYQKL